MKNNHLLGTLLIAAGIASLVAIACSKTNQAAPSSLPADKQSVSLYLTDGPGFFDHVYLDMESVKISVDTCASKHNHSSVMDSCLTWETLHIKPGVYDLLTLRNGVDTLLADGQIPKGLIKQIKIELGANNSLVKSGVKYPLQIPASSSISISLADNEWEEFLPDQKRLWLDFVVAKSIVEVRHNEFLLVPVIHFFVKSKTGGISGFALPHDAYPVITGWMGKDTVYALPDGYGRFNMYGLKPGDYNVFINTSNGYKDTTINKISVKMGEVTKLDTIMLHK